MPQDVVKQAVQENLHTEDIKGDEILLTFSTFS
jgi:hypothetical protein